MWPRDSLVMVRLPSWGVAASQIGGCNAYGKVREETPGYEVWNPECLDHCHPGLERVDISIEDRDCRALSALA